jgi:hypothetical protein
VGAARDAEIAPRTVHAAVRQLAERVVAELPGWTSDFRTARGESPVLQTLPERIRKRAEKTAKLVV